MGLAPKLLNSFWLREFWQVLDDLESLSRLVVMKLPMSKKVHGLYEHDFDSILGLDIQAVCFKKQAVLLRKVSTRFTLPL